jgi:hypothetical protein
MDDVLHFILDTFVELGLGIAGFLLLFCIHTILWLLGQALGFVMERLGL